MIVTKYTKFINENSDDNQIGSNLSGSTTPNGEVETKSKKESVISNIDKLLGIIKKNMEERKKELDALLSNENDESINNKSADIKKGDVYKILYPGSKLIGVVISIDKDKAYINTFGPKKTYSINKEDFKNSEDIGSLSSYITNIINSGKIKDDAAGKKKADRYYVVLNDYLGYVYRDNNDGTGKYILENPPSDLTPEVKKSLDKVKKDIFAIKTRIGEKLKKEAEEAEEAAAAAKSKKEAEEEAAAKSKKGADQVQIEYNDTSGDAIK